MSESYKKILKIEKSPNNIISRYCNVCGRDVYDSKANNLNEDNKMHELSFGKNNYATVICLCTKCLNDFADALWKYLEEEE